jgi:hypothetical protein
MRCAEAVTISASIAGKPRKAFRSTLRICDPVTGKTEIFRKEGGQHEEFCAERDHPGDGHPDP